MDAFTLIELPLPGALYRSAMPYSAYDPRGEVLASYAAARIDMVVVLVESHEIERIRPDLLSLYRTAGRQVLHHPIPDFSVPRDPASFLAAADTALSAVRSGAHVAAHCHAGIGRTGIFAAVLARRLLGLDGPQAVRYVRRFIPDALENEEQCRFVSDIRLDGPYSPGRSFPDPIVK